MSYINILSRDLQEEFSTPDLSEYCIEAANRTSRLFDPSYPGWQLYSRIARNDTLFDRQIAAWSIGMARRYARTRRISGWSVVRPSLRSNDWVSQAGIDAAEYLVAGRYSATAKARADGFDIDDEMYKRLRDGVAYLMARGFCSYQLELQAQYAKVLRENDEFFLGDAA